ncbi:hypothetical protein M2158_004062 [Streptomyces sp. SAI-144]|uniref:hypothetical protein n=1 Tax=Streptomyces sp. SAI-144 TaxID=2940544 RepID=UPI002477021A|nr:hypothetical protein [Streptomyces sp. SAI-144]MDH6435585.1 hypothetical protein [Streptomyces sp. SAI-144]
MTQRNPIAPSAPVDQGTKARVAALHRLAGQDYGSNAAKVARASLGTRYPNNVVTGREPSDLDVAISVAQQLLESDQVPSLREALRLLLRALGAEPIGRPVNDEPPALRCPAAHPEDLTPCTGPIVVSVLDATNEGANGCEHHGARLLASLEDGRVYALPDAPDGAAIRVFKAADTTRPFAWIDTPRTQPSQLSRAENRARGEVQ